MGEQTSQIVFEPLKGEIVDQACEELRIKDLAQASIREIVALSVLLEKKTGRSLLRFDMGIPGLKTPSIGTEAEIEALRRGVSSKYPNIDGIPELKEEASLFLKNFLDVQISPKACMVTVGAMQGAMTAFMTAGRCKGMDHKILFVDPGFPVQKRQVKALGLESVHFDIYAHRGKHLRDKLETLCKEHKFSVLVYSNPNNPTWICLTEEELKTIAEVANKYDIIVLEDLAYFGMDFRNDYSRPGVPPYPPSIVRYTDNYILLISSSKVFSNAGQRISILAVSDKLFNRKYSLLHEHGTEELMGTALIQDGIYLLSAGVSHSAQYGLLAMLQAANSGQFNFIKNVSEYGKRAGRLKQIFLSNGFSIVYDKDRDDPIADGFYFTINYPGMNSGTLIRELFRFGISCISLDIMGSDGSKGARISVSQVGEGLYSELELRLKAFRSKHLS